MNLYTNCYILSQKKELKVNKLTFGDYLQLNLYIESSDYISINHTFDVICEKSFGSSNTTNLDKFFILIHLKNEFLSPILRLSGKNDEEKTATYEVVLKEILENCKKYNDENFNLPKQLYYKDSDEILSEISKNVEEIKKHISENKILLFSVPEMIKGIPKVYLNCFDNTLFYFCKLLYTTNLKDLYRKMVFLKKNFNFSLSEICELSPKELDIFLNTK